MAKKEVIKADKVTIKVSKDLIVKKPKTTAKKAQVSKKAKSAAKSKPAKKVTAAKKPITKTTVKKTPAKKSKNLIPKKFIKKLEGMKHEPPKKKFSKYTLFAYLRLILIPIVIILFAYAITNKFNSNASTWSLKLLIVVIFTIGALHYLWMAIRTAYFYYKPKECIKAMLTALRFKLLVCKEQPNPFSDWSLSHWKAGCRKGIGGYLNFPLQKLIHKSWGVDTTVIKELDKIKGPVDILRFSKTICDELTYQNLIEYTIYLQGFIGTYPTKVNIGLMETINTLKPIIRAGLLGSVSLFFVYILIAIFIPSLL